MTYKDASSARNDIGGALFESIRHTEDVWEEWEESEPGGMQSHSNRVHEKKESE